MSLLLDYSSYPTGRFETVLDKSDYNKKVRKRPITVYIWNQGKPGGNQALFISTLVTQGFSISVCSHVNIDQSFAFLYV